MPSRPETRIIDGDGHVMEDLEAIVEHMRSPYREIVTRSGSVFPPFDHLHDGRAVETPPQREGRGPVGPVEWVDFLDRVGIDWTVLYPTWALAHGRIVSLDYACESARAYNDWLYERYLSHSDRFRGMALVPLQDPAEAVTELRRAVLELGMAGAMLPTNGLPLPLGAKSHWPVYEEADRLGCCLAIHGGCHDRFGMDHMNAYVPVHALGHPWGVTVSCASILYNGIFERFPNVRIAFLEGGVAWLLLLLERLHDSHETHFQYVPDDEYGIREGDDPAAVVKQLIADGRMFLGIEAEELTLPWALRTVGNAPFVYSSDFPHEVTVDSCLHDIGEIVASDVLTDDDKAAILYRNAERLYGRSGDVARPHDRDQAAARS